MKSYAETIEQLAKQAFDRYLGGSNELGLLNDEALVAFIYGLYKANVRVDLLAAYQAVFNEHYAQEYAKRHP